jgi:hypothetical protein
MSTHSTRSRSTLLVAGALCAVGLLAAPCIALAQSRRTPAPPADSAVPDSVLRAAVARHYPAALERRAGTGPVLWVLADRRNRVLRTATGRDGLRQGPLTAETLSWEAAAAKLADMPESASPGDLLQWGHVPTRAGTVDVIWVRISAGLPAR